MPDHRAHFDFDIRFANGGDLTGTGFRLDLPAADLARRPSDGCSSPTSGWPSSRSSNFAGYADVRGAAVLLRTGWDRHFGTDEYGSGAPLLSAEATH